MSETRLHKHKLHSAYHCLFRTFWVSEARTCSSAYRPSCSRAMAERQRRRPSSSPPGSAKAANWRGGRTRLRGCCACDDAACPLFVEHCHLTPAFVHDMRESQQWLWHFTHATKLTACA